MKASKSIIVLGMLVVSVGASAGDVIAKKWDKGGSIRVVAGFDTVKRGLAWEVTPCRVANFAEKTSGGILVGCDDSNVVMLDPETGKTLWRSDLAKTEPNEFKREQRRFREIKVNRFHEERPEGFFVSSSDEVYLLVGKKGEYLMRCDAQDCAANPKFDRTGQ